ncbi:hypothetical protein B484DRAFT_445523 [Ochromonadaceae sp. CCMP2298]|nr:hypothetical protein B484DRAFT_445523 [Ochromonadaceae sp. CCMP2298]
MGVVEDVEGDTGIAEDGDAGGVYVSSLAPPLPQLSPLPLPLSAPLPPLSFSLPLSATTTLPPLLPPSVLKRLRSAVGSRAALPQRRFRGEEGRGQGQEQGREQQKQPHTPQQQTHEPSQHTPHSQSRQSRHIRQHEQSYQYQSYLSDEEDRGEEYSMEDLLLGTFHTSATSAAASAAYNTSHISYTPASAGLSGIRGSSSASAGMGGMGGMDGIGGSGTGGNSSSSDMDGNLSGGLLEDALDSSFLLSPVTTRPIVTTHMGTPVTTHIYGTSAPTVTTHIGTTHIGTTHMLSPGTMRATAPTRTHTAYQQQQQQYLQQLKQAQQQQQQQAYSATPAAAGTLTSAQGGRNRSFFGTAFCAPVEADSDIEGAEGGVKTALFFKEKIENAFQMLKFRWLIRCCRRFIRTLRRQARMKCLYIRGLRIRRGFSRRRSLRAWGEVWGKIKTQADIVDHIYMLRFGRRVLHAWHRQAIERIAPAHSQVAHLRLLCMRRRTLHIWRDFYLQRLRQTGFNDILARSKKVRVLHNWRAYMATLRWSKKIHLTMARRCLKPMFGTWRKKFLRKTLLTRVFSLQQQAWTWRLYSVPSTFERLFAVTDAWRRYTAGAKSLRVRAQQNHRALYFRGASLLARHFHCWIEIVQKVRKLAKVRIVRTQLLAKCCFLQWANHTTNMRGLEVRIDESQDSSRLSRALHLWAHRVREARVGRPEEFWRVRKLKLHFEELRCVKAERVRAEDKNLCALIGANMRKNSFRAWVGLKHRKNRYLRALPLLYHSYWRLKVRNAFFIWPGRKSAAKAHRFYALLSSKRRAHMPLVEIPEITIEPTLSFITIKRPSLLDRAVKLGIVEWGDVDGLHYYREIMSVALGLWGGMVRKDILLRFRCFQVRALLHKRRVAICLLGWILVTPRIAYRQTVWMLKSRQRHHDDYLHRKKLYDEYLRGRRRDAGKSGVVVGVGGMGAGGGGIGLGVNGVNSMRVNSKGMGKGVSSMGMGQGVSTGNITSRTRVMYEDEVEEMEKWGLVTPGM